MTEWNDINKVKPPENGRVLVTNNMAAKSRFGEMSHIWILFPFQCESDYEFGGVNTGYAGEWIGFDDADRRIRNITHWMPLPEALEQ